MRLPQFTAEVSLYRSAHSYGTGGLRRAAGGELRIQPQLNYVCDGVHCGCHGAADCFDCMVSGDCAGTCQVVGDTWICGDGNPSSRARNV